MITLFLKGCSVVVVDDFVVVVVLVGVVVVVVVVNVVEVGIRLINCFTEPTLPVYILF
jgi:hypothetical protein